MNKIKLFAGLGNPGEKFQNTRHNCGFWWVDFVTNNHRLNLKHNAKFNGDIAKYTEDGNCFFLKPTTFMNESGKSLAAVANFYKIRPEEILVIHDELDIEPGKIKLKLGGGDGGHNGLKSVTDSIKSKNFWRIRIGIGHPGNKNLVSNFVLKPPLKKENELIEDSILNSYKIFSLLKSGQFEKAMLNLHSV